MTRHEIQIVQSRISWAESKRIRGCTSSLRKHSLVGCNFHPMSNSYRFASRRKSISREHRVCYTQWTRWISISSFSSSPSPVFSSHCGGGTSDRVGFIGKSAKTSILGLWTENNRKCDSSILLEVLLCEIESLGIDLNANREI